MLSTKAALNALFSFASWGKDHFLTKSLITKNKSCDDDRKLTGCEYNDGDEH